MSHEKSLAVKLRIALSAIFNHATSPVCSALFYVILQTAFGERNVALEHIWSHIDNNFVVDYN